jgi:hypothetical protein
MKILYRAALNIFYANRWVSFHPVPQYGPAYGANRSGSPAPCPLTCGVP